MPFQLWMDVQDRHQPHVDCDVTKRDPQIRFLARLHSAAVSTEFVERLITV